MVGVRLQLRIGLGPRSGWAGVYGASGFWNVGEGCIPCVGGGKGGKGGKNKNKKKKKKKKKGDIRDGGKQHVIVNSLYIGKVPMYLT